MTLAEDISLLIRVPLFADLASDHLRLLAFSSIRLHLPQGRVLFRKDAMASSAFVIMSGAIELAHGEGELAQRLGRFGPGVLLGEMALFVETRRPATATAAVDTEVVEIDRSLMRRMLTEYPDVAVRVHSKLVDRLGSTILELDKVRDRLDAISYPASRAS